MKRNLFVLAIATLFLGPVASGADAQPAGALVWEVLDVEVHPHMRAQYETAIKDANAWREENSYPFVRQGYQTNFHHYRFITQVGDWEGVERAEEWFADNTSGTPSAFVAPLFGAIKSVSRSYIRTRPDLFYVPEGTTILEKFGAANYIHEIRLFPKPGSGRAFTEVMEAFVPVYAANDVQTPRFVWEVRSGSNGPQTSLFFPAESALAFHEVRNADLERMGDEFRSLQTEGLFPNVQDGQFVAWRIRRDLSYIPD